MINIDIQAPNIKEFKKVLERFDNKAPSLLVSAINRAATTAKASMKKQSSGAPSIYRVKPTEVEKMTSIHQANTSTMKAIVTVKGRSKPLSSFSVSPMRKVSYKGKSPNPKKYKAVVMKGHGLISLDKAENKPFVAVTQNGVIGVFSRMGRNDMIRKNMEVTRKTTSGTKKYTYERNVEKLQMHYGPSVPQMIKNDLVFDQVKTDSGNMLNKRMNHEIEALLRRFRI